jgi:mannosyl-3-phosphoglycerate phosphatase
VVFVPKGYFPFPVADGIGQAAGQAAEQVETDGGYEVIKLGAPYPVLRSAIVAMRQMGLPVTGFGDMTPAQISEATGLPPDQAVMAGEREFDEPFYLEGNEGARDAIVQAARRSGLRVSGRGPFHLTGANDKGKAVSLLCALFRKALAGAVFAALGDRPGDLPMLLAVDRPIIVRRPDGTYDPDLVNRGFVEAGGIGPTGWNRAVLELLEHEKGPSA